MINLEFDDKALLKAIDKLVQKTMMMDETWEWPCGVAFYGVTQAYAVIKNEEWIKLLQNRVDEFIELGLPPWTVNTCAMGHCLLTLYEVTGDQRYNEILLDSIDYLTSHALRFGENVLQHTVSINDDFPEQAWADTLFMAGFLMLRVGVRDSNMKLIEDALNQYFWHINFLQNKSNGLWYHGYSHKAKNNLSGFFWARANAWAAYTMSMVSRILPEPYLYPPFMDIDCSLRDQLAGLKLMQTENGLWHTVLNDEESYEELSASCGIAAAMVNRGNPLHTKYAQKSLKGILDNISEDGRLLNVSGGTAVMRDLEGYRKVPKTWTQGWGQGLALAFLASVIRNDRR